MTGTLQDWYGSDASKSSSFSRIINEAHFNRVKQLLEGAGGEIVAQMGVMDVSTKFVPPTIIRNPSPESTILKEEIFGPVLPILTFGSMDEMVAHINAGEKPLAMYIFGREADADVIIQRTSSGGVCVNDTILHISNPKLPFGGIGSSGIGRYHGKWGFD